MKIKTTEHQSMMIILCTYFLCVTGLILYLVINYSPWWILLSLLLYGIKAKCSNLAKCPKCGHEFEYDLEDKQDANPTKHPCGN